MGYGVTKVRQMGKAEKPRYRSVYSSEIGFEEHNNDNSEWAGGDRVLYTMGREALIRK